MTNLVQIRIEIIPVGKKLPISIRTFENNKTGMKEAKEYIKAYEREELAKRLYGSDAGSKK